jgi:MSHA type pilus biogenesis protein MshL
MVLSIWAAGLPAQPISMSEPVSPGPYPDMTTKGVRIQPTGKPDEKKPELSLAIESLIKKQRKARAENNVEEEKQCLIELIRLDPNNPVYRARLEELAGMQPQVKPPGRMKVPPAPPKPTPPVDPTRYEWAVENVPGNVALSLVTHLQSLKTTDPAWSGAMVEVIPVDEAEAEKKMLEGSPVKPEGGSKLQNIYINNLTMGQGQSLMAFWNTVQGTMPEEVGSLTPKLVPWKSAAEMEAKSVGKLSHLIAKKKPRGGSRASGDILYSFTAKDMEITDALALFARLNDLNIVPDPEVKGTITVDFRGLNLDKALEAILEAKGYFAEEEGGLIRVKGLETRYYVLDYLRVQRQGQVQTQADISNIANAGGGSVGGSGGGGGGGGGGSGGGGGASAEGTVTIQSQDTIDIWKDIEKQLREQLSAEGKLSINSMAGTVIITDRRAKIREFDEYFKLLKGTIYRQVDLSMKIMDVELNNLFEAGINWERVAAFVAETSVVAAGNMTGVAIPATILTTLTPATLSVVRGGNQINAVLQALAQQGKLNVISQPRIRTLNHMTALIKVVQETPFFISQSNVLQSQSGNAQGNNVAVNTVSTGTVLSITPQVSQDDKVQLDIQPVVSTLRGTSEFVQTVTTTNNTPVTTTNATAPVIDVKQAASVVRVNDQDTIIMGGLIQEQDVKNKEWIPVLGDIPGIGYLFTGVAEAKVRKELVLFVTPTIVRE